MSYVPSIKPNSFQACRNTDSLNFTENVGHSHASFATIEKSSDGGYMLKALKQKQCVDGLCYLLQEIYGIENKSPERQKVGLWEYER